MEEFSVKGKIIGNVSVAAVTGRVDSATAVTLDSELSKMAHANDRIVLDLSGIAYMSSAGVRAIVKIMQSTSKAGGGVKLTSVPQNVMDVFETVGMMQILQIYPSVDEAVASF